MYTRRIHLKRIEWDVNNRLGIAILKLTLSRFPQLYDEYYNEKVWHEWKYLPYKYQTKLFSEPFVFIMPKFGITWGV